MTDPKDDGREEPSHRRLETRGLALILLAVLLVTLWRWCRVGWSG
jgi:hypothetical protein